MKNKLIAIYSVLFICISTILCGVMQNNVVYAQTESIDLTAKSSILIDYDSNEVLYNKNENARLPIASMVKLMTILLTYESISAGKIKLDDKVTTSEKASGMGGSQVFIDPYVEYSVSDLLKSVIISSANDASVALAEYIANNEESFVDKMNKRAKELKMDNTHYVNCTGLPAPEQYSCAKDCAILLKCVMNNKDYFTFSGIWMDKLKHPSGRETELVNTNKLIRYYNGCDCGKTGSTSEAGYCLSTSAKKDNFRLIAVIIGSKSGKDRFKDATKLLNYGFSNFENKIIVDKDKSILDNFEVSNTKTKDIKLFPKENFYGLSKKGENNEYKLSYQTIKVKAPIKKGEVVGKMVVNKNGKVIKEIDIIVNKNVEKNTYLDNVKQIANNW